MKRLVLALLLIGCGDPCEKPGRICTVVGRGDAGLAPDGTCADESPLYWPSDLTIGPDEHPWILDWNNHRMITVDLDAPKKCRPIHVITGNGLVGDGPPGTASTAYWNHPTNIAFAEDGTYVFAAWHNSRVVGVDPNSDETWYVAGTGARDFGGDGGPAAEAMFDLPSGVAYGPDGRLYVADQANQRIRAIDADGIITTVVGNGEAGGGGDGGPALEASLQSEGSQDAAPAGRIVFHENTLYIADTSNHRIRAVDTDTWMIDTIAGDGDVTPTGDDVDALEGSLHFPRDVAVAENGDVYIADSEDHCVRRVRDGQMTIVAGVCGEKGFDGDRGPGTEALLFRPYGIDVAPDGSLWIADTFNHRIRRVSPGEAE